MLILLPPSEGKSAPAQGPRLDFSALSYPELSQQRDVVRRRLHAVSERPDALDILKVGRRVAAEVIRNMRLCQEPCAPASEVYTGVLYSAARLRDLTADQHVMAQSSVRIFSGLWGVLRPDDPIPAYRLSMGVSLPGLGPLAAMWREHLAPVLDPEAAEQIVVDCRSSTYAGAWRPAIREQWTSVSVLRERAGTRTVVSHQAKQLRGVLVRHLLTRPGTTPRDPEALLAAARELIGTYVSNAPVIDVILRTSAASGARTGSVLEIITRER